MNHDNKNKDNKKENNDADFGTKNRKGQESGGGYDHPPAGAEGYEEE